MQSRIVLLLTILFTSVLVFAQEPELQTRDAKSNHMRSVVTVQFGDQFAIDPKFPPMVGDFDGDGKEDLVVVAKSKNPLAGAPGFQYKVYDPFNSYWGFGNPNLTTGVADLGDGSSHCLLIIHGWEMDSPKAKFVIVNLPFVKLSMSRSAVKKKTVSSIAATEIAGQNGVVYYDGKKYKWEPTGFDTDSDSSNVSSDKDPLGLSPPAR
jgi:hypothetical protein